MFEVIRKVAEPVMTHYKSDLDLDEKDVEMQAGIPFLHFVRPTGTLIVFLWPIEKLPKPGARVPCLFGTADREQIVKNIESMSKYYNNSNNGPCAMVHYFDGQKVIKTTVEKAATIGLAHATKIRNEFRKEAQRGYQRHRNEVCHSV